MAFFDLKNKTKKSKSRALKTVKSDEPYAAPEIVKPVTEREKEEKKSKKTARRALKKERLKGRALAKRADMRVKHSIKGDVKSAGAALLALALAVNIAGVLIADRPDDKTLNAALTPAYVIEETVDMPPGPDDVVQDEDEEDERKNRRITIGGIVFYILSGAISLAVGLMQNFILPAAVSLMSPLLSAVLSWVIFAVAVFGAIIIALKTVFPDVPLKELLSKENVFWISVFIIAVIMIAEILGYYLRDYMIYIKAAVFIAGFVFVAAEFNHLRDRYFA